MSIYFTVENLLRYVCARVHLGALVTPKPCSEGMRSAILRNHINTAFDSTLFHSPFSLKSLILWSPKMATSKSRTQTLRFW